MSSSYGEMGSLLKQAQQMQRQLDRVRAELRERSVEGQSPEGSVRCRITGDRQVVELHISDELASSGQRERIEELVLAALRDGLAKAAAMASEEMNRVTGGVNLPGLF
jgi:DNA-binding YbaB/EbfC family protein